MLKIIKEKSATLACIVLIVLGALFIVYRANQFHQPIVRYDKFLVVEAGDPLTLYFRPIIGRYATLEITNYNMTRDIAVVIKGGGSVRAYALFLRERPDIEWWIYLGDIIRAPDFWNIELEETYTKLLKKSLGLSTLPSIPYVRVIRLGRPHTLPLCKERCVVTIAPTEGSTVLRVRILERTLTKSMVDTITKLTTVITTGIVILLLAFSRVVGAITLVTVGNCVALTNILALFGIFNIALILLFAMPLIAIVLDTIMKREKRK